MDPSSLPDDPQWYKDAVIYELHVRAFCDSDGDGVGDFRGLTSKLDYLQDLGVTALWLLPFYPSPLKDDGYDIADYTSIHPSYGTLDDFKAFLAESHRRGIRVITELVINHTSIQHPWFQRARRAPRGSVERDFYVWSDTPERYKEARIIFKDFEPSNWAWDGVAKAYYWHRFYAHQPDLNFESEAVKRAIFEVLDFWMDLGVDGMRLDAVPYLFERDGTSCENLPETHGFLRELRRHTDAKYRGRMFLSEANQWPEDVLPYFGAGDECHMNFHFPLMPRLFMALRMEDRFPIVDILRQTPPIPETCQWALFLRNHDELTLEMVTDEDRDYMYRMYAHDRQARINLGIRRRLAPLLGNHRRRIELMNGLLFSLPGSPVLYYGDEIGMGDNIYLGDRNGVRTPMQWSADRNAGFSRANPQRLYLPIIIDPEYHYEASNVEAQQNNRSSLLWWMKRLVALRKRYRALGRGTMELLSPRNSKVLAFVRRHGDERLLVVANLSRFAQWADLDLAAFRGTRPVELFGRTKFPPIAEGNYPLTLAPHTFFWFALEPVMAEVEVAPAGAPRELPAIAVAGDWRSALRGRDKSRLEAVLPDWLRARRWFRSKARTIQAVHVADAIPVVEGEAAVELALCDVSYVEGEAETYLVPLSVARGADAERAAAGTTAIARLRAASGEEVALCEASGERRFLLALLETIAAGRSLAGAAGAVEGHRSPAFEGLRGGPDASLEPALLGAEQSNTSAAYGERLVVKLSRRLEAGQSLDLEIGRFLTERRSFPNTPPIAGALDYRPRGGEPRTLAVLQGFVANSGDAWRFTRDALGLYFERTLARRAAAPAPPAAPPLMTALLDGALPDAAEGLVGTYLESAALLGRRTGEMHLALASDLEDPAFAPEPYNPFYQRSIYQANRSMAQQTLDLLRARLDDLRSPDREAAERILARGDDLDRKARAILDRRLETVRIRIHGDYHLGQVLHTGRDFAIIDFEGEPLRPLSERRIKRSPLRDVAGMLRSFHYATAVALRHRSVRPEDVAALAPHARFWQVAVSATFFRAYRATTAGTRLVPEPREDLEALLDLCLLDKALYEVGYELNNRPDWVRVPLEGILDLLDAPANDGDRGGNP